MMPIDSNDGSEKLYEYMHRNRTRLNNVLHLCFKLHEFYTYAYAKKTVFLYNQEVNNVIIKSKMVDH